MWKEWTLCGAVLSLLLAACSAKPPPSSPVSSASPHVKTEAREASADSEKSPLTHTSSSFRAGYMPIFEHLALARVLRCSGSPADSGGSGPSTARAAIGEGVGVVERWVQLIDTGRYAESHAATVATSPQSGEYGFYPREHWVQMMTASRAPFEALARRSLVRTTSDVSLNALMPPGEYLLVHFDATFAAGNQAREFVLAYHDVDGRWRICGYFLHPGKPRCCTADCQESAEAGGEVSASALAGREGEGVAIAQAWLKLLDEGSYQESYATAALLFRSWLTAEEWKARIADARGQYGASVKRTRSQVVGSQSMPHAPDGEYLVIRYEQVAFDKQDDRFEAVILVEDTDGKWRVAGYFLD